MASELDMRDALALLREILDDHNDQYCDGVENGDVAIGPFKDNECICLRIRAFLLEMNGAWA